MDRSEFTWIYETLKAKDARQKAFADALLEFLALSQMAQNVSTPEHVERFIFYFKRIINNWCPALKDEYLENDHQRD